MTLKTKNNQHLWSQFETQEARLQVVMLGASNLSRSFPWAVQVAQQALARPISIHAAMGFGRSYGKETGFLGKKFSGIFFSRLWQSWAPDATSSTLGFVTDIGNDLAYEQPVESIVQWVEGCVIKLSNHGAKVVLTDIPLDALRSASRAKFYALRSILFPTCRLSFHTMIDRAEELRDRLHTLAESQKIPIFAAPNAWYGFDPIHPRGRYLRDYWRELFVMADSSSNEIKKPQRSLSAYWRIRLLRSPGAGCDSHSSRHSSARTLLSDGTTVALY